VVAEGLVALAHRGAEAGLGGALLEGVALLVWRVMPSNTVPRTWVCLQALGVQRLVDEQLHHLQLVERVARDPLDQDLGALVELGGGGASIARPHSSASAPDSESPVNSSRLARWGPSR
jgi:hypothetical protein